MNPEHLLFSARGTLGQGANPGEAWSCGLRCSRPAGFTDDQADMDSHAEDVFKDWAAFITTASARVSNVVRLTEVRAYSIGTDGLSGQRPIGMSSSPPVQGVSASSVHPWQCSLVLTLVAEGRGQGRLGRIYLPPQAVDLDGDGGVAPGQITGILAACKTLIESVGNKVGVDSGFGVRVVGTTQRPGQDGTIREVKSIRLGRVVDTQRRRRRSLDEQYQETAVST